MKKRMRFVPLISVLILIFASCERTFYTTDGQTWGTTYHIVYNSAKNLDVEIREELKRIDSELSMFNPASTVSMINSGLTDSVSDDFREVFTLAKHISGLTGGMYDPTVAPLTDLWGFGRTESGALPDSAAVAEALASVGIGDCDIDAEGKIVKKSEDTAFDFSSIAKGYGVECIGRLLERSGCSDYLVEIGGEILSRGHNPKGKNWRIQLDAPAAGNSHTRMSVFELDEERTAIATSGNYRRFRSDEEGRQLGHTISPVTGYPVQSGIASATVFASDCATADALATACMALGDTIEVKRILSATGTHGIMVTADGTVAEY